MLAGRGTGLRHRRPNACGCGTRLPVSRELDRAEGEREEVEGALARLRRHVQSVGTSLQESASERERERLGEAVVALEGGVQDVRKSQSSQNEPTATGPPPGRLMPRRRAGWLTPPVALPLPASAHTFACGVVRRRCWAGSALKASPRPRVSAPPPWRLCSCGDAVRQGLSHGGGSDSGRPLRDGREPRWRWQRR